MNDVGFFSDLEQAVSLSKMIPKIFDLSGEVNRREVV